MSAVDPLNPPQLQTHLAQPQEAEYTLENLYAQVEERNIELGVVNGELQQAIEALYVAEEELRQQNLELETERFKYQDLFNFAPDGYLVTDPLGVIQAANQAVAYQLNLAPEHLVGNPLILYVAPASHPWFHTQFHRRLCNHQKKTVEIAFQPRQGAPFPAEVTIAPIFNEADIVTGLRWLIRDITDRKQAEETIRQQVKRETLLREITQRIRQSLDLQTIFDTACQEICQFIQADRVGIFKFYPESNFDDGEFVAESAVSGFPSVVAVRVHDHCFGENYAPLYAKGQFQAIDDIYHSGLQSCHTDILAQFQVRANLIVPLLCGEALWGLLCIHQCASPRHWQQSEIELTQQLASQLAIAIQQAKLVKKLQQELTERQQAETKLTEINQQLAISNEELARATRLKDEFLANMSHELRTPLNAILGLSEGLQEEIFGPLTDRQKNTITTIERSGQHLLSLINDILEVSKIAAGKLELEMTEVSIHYLCSSSLAFVKEQANRKRIQLHTHIPPDLSTIIVDERRMRQVLINLLTNAVKFTPNGGQVTVAIELEPIEINGQSPLNPPFLPNPLAQEPGGEFCPLQDYVLCISVIDTGIGIAAADQANLFQPFVQLDSSLNRKYEGTGLGLTLVKQIVELHGGSVVLESEVEVGSCFTLRLPYCSSLIRGAVHPKMQIPSIPLARPLIAVGNRPLILLVEDNEVNISTFSSYLTAKQYRLLLARNGQEAIDLAQAHKPDLILMDIQMPGMDGLEAIGHIRHTQNLVHCPIIALTALAMPGDRERCMEAGANDYLTKPVRLQLLLNRIQQLLASQGEN